VAYNCVVRSGPQGDVYLYYATCGRRAANRRRGLRPGVVTVKAIALMRGPYIIYVQANRGLRFLRILSRYEFERRARRRCWHFAFDRKINAAFFCGGGRARGGNDLFGQIGPPGWIRTSDHRLQSNALPPATRNRRNKCSRAGRYNKAVRCLAKDPIPRLNGTLAKRAETCCGKVVSVIFPYPTRELAPNTAPCKSQPSGWNMADARPKSTNRPGPLKLPVFVGLMSMPAIGD